MSSSESDRSYYSTVEGSHLQVPSPLSSDRAGKINNSRKRESDATLSQSRKQRKMTSIKVTGKKKGKKGACAQCAELALKVQEEKWTRQCFEYDNKKAKEKLLEIQALHQIIVRALDDKKKFYDSISRIVNANYEHATASSPLKDIVDVK